MIAFAQLPLPGTRYRIMRVLPHTAVPETYEVVLVSYQHKGVGAGTAVIERDGRRFKAEIELPMPSVLATGGYDDAEVTLYEQSPIN